MQSKVFPIVLFVLLAAALGTEPSSTAAQAQAQAQPSAGSAQGAAVYERECAGCHATSESRAPARDALRAMSPEAIHNALVNGRMQLQGSSLSEVERRAVAEFLAERSFGAAATAPVASARCTPSAPMSDPARGPGWNGWGNGISNTRYAKDGGLTAADLPKLKLKWAFGYANVNAARAQPALAGGRLFVASENGEVHALDAKTGCIHWTYKAAAGVRAALSVASYKGGGGSGYAVYFGDERATVYAVDANTGRQIWIRKVDDHPAAGITGAPVVHAGRVYVPVQGINEEAQGGRGGYACCTFRGSVSALDANTGTVLWKTYTIDASTTRGKGKDGVQLSGPAGGGIWAAPTVDPTRNLIYVATGNLYAGPPQKMANAVIALDINTGTVKWVNQVTPNDIWTFGCPAKNPDNPACPETLGPDLDFSASPALTTVNGRDLLVLPQKSGMAFAMDPDNEGRIVWQQRIGRGGFMGGQYGAAVDEQNAYIGVADVQSQSPGGIRALRLTTGEIAWSVEPQARLCGDGRGCRAGQGGATTLIPGAVFSGSLDGGMRAYSAKDGTILWTFDTNREFQTVNGVKASGGGIEGNGAIVAGGMLFFNSGWGGFMNRPGNVLLAFGIN
jgi:polyvinyl alcohol dehydrogenase (cytochrome)